LPSAAEVVEQGTGDLYEEANVLSTTASLLIDFEKAADIALARSVRDRPLERPLTNQNSRG
jgi:hypothetical protein